MKKFVCIILAAAMLLSLSACGKTGSAAAEVKNEKTVEITLPQGLIGEMTQEDINSRAGENYVSGVLNSDGSVTYVMTETQHKAFIQLSAESIDNSLTDFVNDEYYAISKIEHNADYSVFDIYLETETIGFSESFLAITVYMLGCIYSIAAGTDADNIVINYYDCNGNLTDTIDGSQFGAGSETDGNDLVTVNG